jgi:hypothetical protein
MVIRFSFLSTINIFLMMTVRRCCVSAWVATSHHLPQQAGATLSSQSRQQAAQSLHPAFLRCRGGNSDAPGLSAPAIVSGSIGISRSMSSRGGADVLASNTSSQDLEQTQHSIPIPSPESLQNLGGGFTTCHFGGLSYWDTSSLNKFRVIFVLGGPGAGMYSYSHPYS